EVEGLKDLGGRKVTLDTGEGTFWEAFDQFCDKAGLVEKDLLKEKPRVREIAPAGRDDTMARVRRERMRWRGQEGRRGRPEGAVGGGGWPADRPAPTRLVLTGGKSPALATCYLGAVRIQVVPFDPEEIGRRKKAGETAVALVVRLEPKVKWHRLQHLGVTSARDGKGRPVKGFKKLDDLPNAGMMGPNAVRPLVMGPAGPPIGLPVGFLPRPRP